MRLIYSLLFNLLTPFLVLRLLWKSRKHKAYRQRIKERFCLQNGPSKGVDVWIHAVSLGEVIAASPLIQQLLENKISLLITTTTPTGSMQVKKTFGNNVIHCYVPFDLGWVAKRFLRRTKPRCALFVETELWPNLVYYASQMHIPLFIINARLSQRSFEGYQKIPSLFKHTLQKFDKILAQTEEDALRFIKLGAKPQQVDVYGNMKFDLQINSSNQFEANRFLNIWGASREILILASTHHNEEECILNAFKAIKTKMPDLLLLIAPRHPERFASVYQMSLKMGYQTGLRSDENSLNSKNEVVIIDSLGELLGFYGISHYAFVGGSLVPVGGHNVLEPIAMQVPVLTGPHVHNFQAICHDLQKAKGIELVANAVELTEKIFELTQNKTRKETQIRNANAVLQKNKGVLNRYIKTIELALET